MKDTVTSDPIAAREYRIRSDYHCDHADGSFLFWSRSLGWVDNTQADYFSEEDKASVALPLTGEWEEVE